MEKRYLSFLIGYLVLFITFLTPLISSEGLQITSNESFIINKTIGKLQNFTFTLYNSASENLYNLNFESNDVLFMGTIPKMSSGESKSVIATLYTDEDFYGTLKIKGFYNRTLGVSNETYEVDVDWDNGLSRCDFSIIKGDKIKWNNKVDASYGDPIRLIQSSSPSSDFLTIPRNSSRTEEFAIPMVFDYYFKDKYGAIKFTDECRITVLDDHGLINDPQLDASLNLDLKVNYEPTNITVLILQNNYTMDFMDTQQGILSITNNGPNKARKIHLSGEWFKDFTYNDFDLDPGLSRNVGYTISPIITNTSETNKTYLKKLDVGGNFPKQVFEFNIRVNYALIDDSTFNSSEGLIQFIVKFCNENPDICNTEPKIIYRNINNTDQSFNVTYNQEQVKGIYAMLFDEAEKREIFENYAKEMFFNISDRTSGLEMINNETANQISKINENIEETNGVWTFLTIIGSSFAILLILWYMILLQRRRNKLKGINKF